MIRRALILFLAMLSPALFAAGAIAPSARAEDEPATAAQANPALTKRAILPMLAADSATGLPGVVYIGGLTPAGGTGSLHTAGTVLELCYSLTPAAAFDYRLYKTPPGGAEAIIVASSDTGQGCTVAALSVNAVGRTDFRMQFLVGGQVVATATTFVIATTSSCTGAPQPCTQPYAGTLTVDGGGAGSIHLANSAYELCYALTPTNPFEFRIYRTWANIETLVAQANDDGTGDCLQGVLPLTELGRRDFRIEFRVGNVLVAEASTHFFVAAP